MENPYNILGVSPSASTEDIKKAYRALAMRHHPDRNPHSSAEIRFNAIKKAYELEGISEMSAQSKKPADVESGKAMQTLEDIESDRFNVQLQRFTHFLVDVSRLCIDVFPPCHHRRHPSPPFSC